MVYPYSGEEMEDGYLQSSRMLIWSSKKIKDLFVPNAEDGTIKVSEGAFEGYLKSYYCRSCNMIISIPHKKNIKQGTK